MRRVHILVEGQTEEAVVRDLIKPYVETRGSWVDYSILATKRPAAGGKFRGGVSTWPKIEREIFRLLGNTSLDLLTTMIDYYGLPEDVPGMRDRPDGAPRARVEHVERSLQAAIGSPRFRPHLVLHETEAWVLAAGQAFADQFGRADLRDQLHRMVAQAGGPELVNDGVETAPSKRLERLLPGYGKVADGPAILSRAGLSTVMAQCPHAREWLESLVG